jgi:hypothetical protein
VNLVGSLEVSGQGGGDGADLLVPGGDEERRRAAVGLHPDDEEPGLGVREGTVPVRGNCSARVVSRIDQWRERRGRLQSRVEVQAELAEHGQVGAKAGGAWSR